jgi:hypothetical protein
MLVRWMRTCRVKRGCSVAQSEGQFTHFMPPSATLVHSRSGCQLIAAFSLCLAKWGLGVSATRKHRQTHHLPLRGTSLHTGWSRVRKSLL